MPNTTSFGCGRSTVPFNLFNNQDLKIIPRDNNLPFPKRWATAVIFELTTNNFGLVGYIIIIFLNNKLGSIIVIVRHISLATVRL